VLMGKGEIARLLPHAGEMCLLDSVESWDSVGIVTLATSHQSAGNPLRRDGGLGVLCGIEYAAQAMAVHAALTAPRSGRPGRGYLAALRSVLFYQDRLDGVSGSLKIEARCLHQEASRAVYRFEVRNAERNVLEGRAIVVIESDAP
jgi:predicted hotdog family 3-hydroxylacyl-ACP dehydratase